MKGAPRGYIEIFGVTKRSHRVEGFHKLGALFLAVPIIVAIVLWVYIGVPLGMEITASSMETLQLPIYRVGFLCSSRV